jgi:hypothetical protein
LEDIWPPDVSFSSVVPTVINEYGTSDISFTDTLTYNDSSSSNNLNRFLYYQVYTFNVPSNNKLIELNFNVQHNETVTPTVLDTQVKYILFRKRSRNYIRYGTNNPEKWDNTIWVRYISLFVNNVNILKEVDGSTISNNVDTVDAYITQFRYSEKDANENYTDTYENQPGEDETPILSIGTGNNRWHYPSLIGPRNATNNILGNDDQGAENAILSSGDYRNSENNWTQNEWGGLADIDRGGALLITMKDTAKFNFFDMQTLVYYAPNDTYAELGSDGTVEFLEHPDIGTDDIQSLWEGNNGRVANSRFELYNSNQEIIAYSDIYGGLGDAENVDATTTHAGNTYPMSRYDGHWRFILILPNHKI